MDDVLQIRSFRVVFDLERRIHRIDQFRVPLPYGLPLRSLGYGVTALIGVLVLGRLPLVGGLLGLLPAPARYVLVPIGVSYALTQLRLDGRTAHAAVVAWLRYVTAPRALVAFRPLPGPELVRLGEVTCAVGGPPCSEAPAVDDEDPVGPAQMELW
jgi:hypothetical protein